jgi:hypothetical protein
MNESWLDLETDGMAAAHKFRQAIAGWARHYSLLHRHSPEPRPTVQAAQEDLRRWSTRYFTPSPMLAAGATIVTCVRVSTDPDPIVN